MHSEYLSQRNYVSHRAVVPFLDPTRYGLWDATTNELVDGHSVNLSPSSFMPDRPALFCPKDTYRKIIENRLPCIENAILSIDQQAPNYYHFLAYVLPDILGMLLGDPTETSANEVVVVSDLPKFAVDFFRLFGIRNRIVSARNLPVLINKARSASAYYQNDQSYDDFEALMFVRSLIFNLHSHVLPDNSFPKRVFVERRQSNNGCVFRKLYPQSLLHQDLQRFGWTLIYLEDLPILDQLKIFYNADVVMGIHGAGLTNMIASLDTKIIEICHETGCNPVFQTFASKASIDIRTITTPSILDGFSNLSSILMQEMNASTQSLPLEYSTSIRELLLRAS